MSELLSFLTTNENQFRRARLAALYSDFRQQRTLNPDGYKANIEAWQKGLSDAAKGGHLPSNSATNDLLLLRVDDSLLRALETKELGRPLALGTVIQDAVSKREFVPIEQFVLAKESIYHKSWSVSPWQMISWGLRQLGFTQSHFSEDKLPVSKLVILSNVEEATKQILKQIGHQTGRVDRIYSKKLFYQAFKSSLGQGCTLSEDDLNILLKYLDRDRGLMTFDGQTIKFKNPSSATPSSITAEDTTIASLKELIVDIEVHIRGLSQQVDKLSINANDALRRKNRVAALAALRSKRLVESNLAKESAVLGQLEEVFAKIGQASDQVELVHIMKGSTEVLKAFHKELGGVERVDDIVDQLKEQMIQVGEIETALAEMDQGANSVDEGEIDEELKSLEPENREKTDEAALLEKEARERQEVLETRRKLDGLATAGPQALLDQTEPSGGLEALSQQKVSSLVDENTTGLQRMSL